MIRLTDNLLAFNVSRIRMEKPLKLNIINKHEEVLEVLRSMNDTANVPARTNGAVWTCREPEPGSPGSNSYTLLQIF